jgi:hypothetical protein
MSKYQHINQNNESNNDAILLGNNFGIIHPEVEDEIKKESNNDGM